MRTCRALAAVFIAATLSAGSLAASIPQYTIVDLGLLPGDLDSQGLRVSPNGGFATGRSLRTTEAHAFSWTQSGGQVGLPNLASPARNFGVGNGVNDSGVIVGNGATTLPGAGALPLIWQGGMVTQLPLPTGQTVGRANDINNHGIAVGSVNGSVSERGVYYTDKVGTVITQTTSGGCYLKTARAINDAGLIVGSGIDPGAQGRNVGFVFDSATNSAYEVGALPGFNGAICFDVSESGYVAGSSSYDQGTRLPFIWSAAEGIRAIPLAEGTTQGSAYGVNSQGWVVGTDGSAYAIPFLWDGTTTYRLAELLPAGSGWDLSGNTFSSAMSISDNGVIVGTGVYQDARHAYAMIPIPEPGTLCTLALAVATVARRRRH